MTQRDYYTITVYHISGRPIKNYADSLGDLEKRCRRLTEDGYKWTAERVYVTDITDTIQRMLAGQTDLTGKQF